MQCLYFLTCEFAKNECPDMPGPEDTCTVFKTITASQKPLSTEGPTEASLLYRMARLMRNSDNVPLTRWGVEAGKLLSELRDLDIQKYEKFVW